MFNNQPRTIEVEGRELPVASMIRRGGALAVDLCIGVLVAMALLWLLSQRLPLDSDDAGLPIVGVVLLVGFYLIWARDHIVPSVGRYVFALYLVRVGAGVPGVLARPITVYDVTSMRDEYARVGAAVALALTASMISVVLGAHGLTSTSVYRAAAAFAERTEPFSNELGTPPRLEDLPRALLIGEAHAFVHIGATWGTQVGGIDFFLSRSRKRDPWTVQAVRRVEQRFHGRYGLKVPDDEVPRPE